MAKIQKGLKMAEKIIVVMGGKSIIGFISIKAPNF
jgi:hypothetical protein